MGLGNGLVSAVNASGTGLFVVSILASLFAKQTLISLSRSSNPEHFDSNPVNVAALGVASSGVESFGPTSEPGSANDGSLGTYWVGEKPEDCGPSCTEFEASWTVDLQGPCDITRVDIAFGGTGLLARRAPTGVKFELVGTVDGSPKTYSSRDIGALDMSTFLRQNLNTLHSCCDTKSDTLSFTLPKSYKDKKHVAHKIKITFVVQKSYLGKLVDAFKVRGTRCPSTTTSYPQHDAMKSSDTQLIDARAHKYNRTRVPIRVSLYPRCA